MLASGEGPIREWDISGGKIDLLLQEIVHASPTAIAQIGYGKATGNVLVGSEHLGEERGIKGRA